MTGKAIALYGYGGGYGGILTSDVSGSNYSNKAQYTIGESDAAVTYTAVKPGFDGNYINITYIVAGANTTLSIAVVDNSITVNVATDSGGLPLSTALEIANAINADPSASPLITAVYKGTGLGIVADTYGGYNLEGGLEMWMAEGVFVPILLKTPTVYTDVYPEYYDFYVDQYYGAFNGGGTIAMGDNEGYSGNLYDVLADMPEPWGIWANIQFGTYSGTTSDDWLMLAMDQEEDFSSTHWLQMVGDTWSEGDIAADVAGAWITVGMGTGVIGGELVGTFDPVAYTWQAIATGSYIDTPRFLDMVANNPEALEALNIPYIEVGRTNLSYEGTTGNLQSVYMNDVMFFAYSDDASPKIWATGDVNGTTTTAIAVDDSATLSGTDFGAVDFTVNYSDGFVDGSWGASVSGAGTVGGHDINITGGAAGTINSTTDFSGTGAGIATPEGVGEE
jgi:hypothetical protein